MRVNTITSISTFFRSPSKSVARLKINILVSFHRNMLKTSLLIIATLTVLTSLYLRIRAPFWRTQPVFHIYDLHHWIRPCGLIDADPPQFNRYVDRRLKTMCVDDLDSEMVARLTGFINDNFLRELDVHYAPSSSDIFLPLTCFGAKPLLTVQKEDTLLSSADGTLANDYRVIACITSRPIAVTISGDTMLSNYVDNLCVRKGSRKSGIAPTAIQTHLYDAARINTNIKTCLFKREGEMTGIVPLTLYQSHIIDPLQTSIPSYVAGSKIVRIDDNNMHFFVDLWRHEEKRFSVIAKPDAALLRLLLQKKHLYCYGEMVGTGLSSAFLFRAPCTHYKSKLVGDCVMSIVSTQSANDVSLSAFQRACRRYMAKTKCELLLIEELGDSAKVWESMDRLGVRPLTTCPCAYFMHNYATYTVPKEKCMMLV